jgi:hypothetical protein
MDINGFREPQSPFFFNQPPTYLIEVPVKNKVLPIKTTEPTPDNRFPGWAAPMEDGRLITDYRPHCALNFPTGTQFASRQFLTKNAESIMEMSRKRQAEWTGAGRAFDSATVMPPAAYITCNEVECGYSEAVEGGVGVKRVERVPELFGTFAYSGPSFSKPAQPLITTKYEGGRNTVRGVFNDYRY